jgi:transposase
MLNQRAPERKLPDTQKLAELYTVGNMSLAAIGKLYGAGRSAVYNALKRAGIERRLYTRGRGRAA